MSEQTNRTEDCVICGKKNTAHERHRDEELFLLGKQSSFTVTEFECTSCKETYTDDAQAASNEAARRTAMREALEHVGATELRSVRDQAGVTQTELENLLGTGKNTVARWETGLRPIPPYIKTIVRLLAINPLALTLLRGEKVGSARAPKAVRVDETDRVSKLRAAASFKILPDRPHSYVVSTPIVAPSQQQPQVGYTLAAAASFAMNQYDTLKAAS